MRLSVLPADSQRIPDRLTTNVSPIGPSHGPVGEVSRGCVDSLTLDDPNHLSGDLDILISHACRQV